MPRPESGVTMAGRTEERRPTFHIDEPVDGRSVDGGADRREVDADERPSIFLVDWEPDGLHRARGHAYTRARFAAGSDAPRPIFCVARRTEDKSVVRRFAPPPFRFRLKGSTHATSRDGSCLLLRRG
jgi:hypothetical protein